MLKLALLVALGGPPAAPQPPWAGGRVYTSSALHVGLRPAVYIDPDEVAVGVTVQVTAVVF